MRKKYFTILIFFVTALSGFATLDSLIFKVKPLHKKVTESYTENGVNITFTKKKLGENVYLFYKNNINSLYTRKNFKDSAWTALNCEDTYDFEDNDYFTGQATFRLHYKFTDSTLNTPIVCELNQTGASEIYIDGNLVKKYGKLGTSKNDEEIEIPLMDPFYIQQSDTLEHVLTVLYSNYTGLERSKHLNNLGIEVKFFFFDDYQKDSEETNLYDKFLIGLFAFFFALAIVHFLLYFADRTKRFNLFYALFLLMIALTSIKSVVTAYIGSPGLLEFINKIESFFIPFCMFFLLNLMYSLFKKKFNGFFYLQAVFLVCFIISKLFDINSISSLAFAAMFFSTYGGVTVIAIKAIRRKYNGGNYLGWGVLSFTLLFILGVIASAIFHDSLWLLIFFAGSILSLPLSMTAYLSHDFAVTSRSLKEELAHNEELSRKTIEQEKEKQEILSNQNKVLEIQVDERTKEIATQNKVLEHQKKEITDSINYAKRIQQALLPDLDEVKKHLPDSFILYLPKDIVSGDFYFFKKKDDALYIAAADCTGHGVPGALMSMIVHEKLSYALSVFSEPSQILQSINQQVKDALKQTQTENASRDGCDIALCKITSTTVTYAGAYRPLYAFSKQNEFAEIKATKTAIAGLTPYDQVFNETVFQINDLKCIYLFSDGYADQFGGEKSKKLTTKKFKELLASIVDLSIEEQNEKLSNFFTKWRSNVEQIDDVLVVGIRF